MAEDELVLDTDEDTTEPGDDEGFDRWWKNRGQSNLEDFHPNSALSEEFFRAAWEQGLRGEDLRKFFQPSFEDVLGVGGTEGAVVDYLIQNPDQIKRLSRFLERNKGAEVGGPGGLQDKLFDKFPELKQTYYQASYDAGQLSPGAAAELGIEGGIAPGQAGYAQAHAAFLANLRGEGGPAVPEKPEMEPGLSDTAIGVATAYGNVNTPGLTPDLVRTTLSAGRQAGLSSEEVMEYVQSPGFAALGKMEDGTLPAVVSAFAEKPARLQSAIRLGRAMQAGGGYTNQLFAMHNGIRTAYQGAAGLDDEQMNAQFGTPAGAPVMPGGEEFLANLAARRSGTYGTAFTYEDLIGGEE